ncbi:hypothetical protein JXB31_01235 [Candidatus Woesearchaeota archaeon]|nr:hypothetical protein [Candidatus Woesearchaeota archaeon]
MKNRMFFSRKGFLTDPLVDIMAFIAIVVIIVIFGVLFNVIKAAGAFEIDARELKLDAESTLIQVLNTPVSVDGLDTDIAGLIVYAEGDEERVKLLRAELQKILMRVIERSSMGSMELRIHDYIDENVHLVEDVTEYGVVFEREEFRHVMEMYNYEDFVGEVYLPGHEKTYTVVLVASLDED